MSNTRSLTDSLLDKLDNKEITATCSTCNKAVTPEDGILFVDDGKPYTTTDANGDEVKKTELFYFFLCTPCFEQNRSMW